MAGYEFPTVFSGALPEENDAGVSLRKRNGRVPAKGWQERSGLGKLGGTDQQGERSTGRKQSGSERKGMGKALDGAHGYEMGTGAGVSLGATGEYIDIHQSISSDDFFEEGGFLVLRFDERELERRGPDLEGQGGESSAGAEVNSARDGVMAERRRGCGRVDMTVRLVASSSR